MLLSPVTSPNLSTGGDEATPGFPFDIAQCDQIYGDATDIIGYDWNFENMSSDQSTNSDGLQSDTEVSCTQNSSLVDPPSLGFGSEPPTQTALTGSHLDILPPPDQDWGATPPAHPIASQNCLQVATSLLLQLKYDDTLAEDGTPPPCVNGSTPLGWSDDACSSTSTSTSSNNSNSGSFLSREESGRQKLLKLRHSIKLVTEMNRKATKKCMSILFCECSMMVEVSLTLSLVAFQIMRRYASVPQAVAEAGKHDRTIVWACVEAVLVDLRRLSPLVEILGRRWDQHEPLIFGRGQVAQGPAYGQRSIPVSIDSMKGIESDLGRALTRAIEETVALRGQS